MGDETSIERVPPLGGSERSAAELIAGRRTVVCGLPLQPAARQRLARLLGARVLDIRDTCDGPDLVLAPAASPQLIGALTRRFPGARIVVVELDDEELDIHLGGPVKRLLRGGAEGYVLADSIDELAAALGTAAPADDTSAPTAKAAAAPGALEGGAPGDDLFATFVRDAVERSARPNPVTPPGRR